MTYKELFISERSDWSQDDIDWVLENDCPETFYKGAEFVGCTGEDCPSCWDREVPENRPVFNYTSDKPIAKVTGVKYENGGVTVTAQKVKDSGDRTQFKSGAVRDMHTGKGDMVSLPAAAILRLSKHYENGAEKYGRWNYTKGIPVSSFMDSALRHIFKYLDGWDDEDHLSAAAFNILGAMEMEAHHKDLNDLPNREGKNDFVYTGG